MRRFFPNLAFMALRLRNPRVRLHKYPFISIIYHNLTFHIIMSAVNSESFMSVVKLRKFPDCARQFHDLLFGISTEYICILWH